MIVAYQYEVKRGARGLGQVKAAGGQQRSKGSRGAILHKPECLVGCHHLLESSYTIAAPFRELALA
jgi:hypothetical protein